MNSYNDNLQSTVVALLQQQELNQKDVTEKDDSYRKLSSL